MSFVIGHPAYTEDIEVLFEFGQQNHELFTYIRDRGNQGIVMGQIVEEIKVHPVMSKQWEQYQLMMDTCDELSGMGAFILTMRVCDFVTKGIKS